MRPPRRPAPPPLEANDRRVTVVIMTGWAAALMVLLVLRDRIPPGQRWWIWTCATGLAMGGFGLWFVPHLKRSRAASTAARERHGAGHA